MKREEKRCSVKKRAKAKAKAKAGAIGRGASAPPAPPAAPAAGGEEQEPSDREYGGVVCYKQENFHKACLHAKAILVLCSQ